MASNNSVGEWGRVESYNLSQQEMQLVGKRYERRMALKKEFHRLLFNPFTNMKVEGGAPFDPALQRFTATRADYYPYFKPNKRNFAWMIGVYWIPLGLLIYFGDRSSDEFDARCRNGEIPWRYRSYKW